MIRPITYIRLKNIALFYLERYDASCSKLTAVLHRHIQKAKIQGLSIPPETDKWIKQIIQECQNLGFLNDIRYTENQVRILSEQGKSSRFITQKMKLAGINDDLIQSALSEQNDLIRAQIFVRKKRLGFNPQKDLAKLARAGFSYEIAKQVLHMEDVDV